MAALPPAPPFRRLSSGALRARLTTIREHVGPILAHNALPHFTDHSVTHSDQLCDIVDSLTDILGEASEQLNNVEAYILYAACYLHDAGMQHERADTTPTITAVLLGAPYNGQRWSELAIPTRRELLRRFHPQIAKDMIRQSIHTVEPILGIALTDDDYPGYISSLCVAHGETPGTTVYVGLTADGPEIRMQLLAALLRIADLLDESRRRACLYLERTTELDLESQMHWWRHHYVRDVTFDGSTHAITIWFDFPPDRRSEYTSLVPALQTPYLQHELQLQRAVLVANHITWHLGTRDTPIASSTAVAMPNAVQLKMADFLAARRADASQAERIAILAHLRETRPSIQRQLDQIRESASIAGPDSTLTATGALAQQLFSLGGRREASNLLHSEFSRLHKSSSPNTVMAVGLQLSTMLMATRSFDMALRHLTELRAYADAMDNAHTLKQQWRSLYATACIEMCAYPNAVDIINEIVSNTTSRAERRNWVTRLAEVHLLQGELERAIDILARSDDA